MNVPPSHSQAFQLHRCRLRRQRSTSNSCPNYVPRSSVAMGTHGHGARAFGVVTITARQPNRMPPARSACGNQCAWTAHRHTSCTGRPRPDGPQRKARSQKPDAVLVNCGSIRLITACNSYSGRKPAAPIVLPGSWPCHPSTRPTSRSSQPACRRISVAGPRPSARRTPR